MTHTSSSTAALIYIHTDLHSVALWMKMKSPLPRDGTRRARMSMHPSIIMRPSQWRISLRRSRGVAARVSPGHGAILAAWTRRAMRHATRHRCCMLGYVVWPSNHNNKDLIKQRGGDQGLYAVGGDFVIICLLCAHGNWAAKGRCDSLSLGGVEAP